MSDWSGTYVFSFPAELPLDAIEDTLMVAALAVESLVGRPSFKLNASFRLDKKNRTCRIDATTPAGKQIAKVFAGLVAREFGEAAYRVERESITTLAAAN